MPFVVFILVMVAFIFVGWMVYLAIELPTSRAARLDADQRRLQAETVRFLDRSVNDPMWRQTDEYEKTARRLADRLTNSI